MRDQLTQSDIDKMQQEIEYRKLVKRPGASGSGKRDKGTWGLK